jgi:hypothetical protein
MKTFFYVIIAIIALSTTSCNGVLRQDISLEKDGSGTMVYTMDYSSGMGGMSAFGNVMEELGNSMGEAFDEMEEDEEIMEEDSDYGNGDEDLEEENPFKDMKMKKDTTFTIAAFMKANKDSIAGKPYYTKERIKALTALGNVEIHEVNDIKNASFFMEVKTSFKNLSELENIESLMAQLLTADKSALQDEDGPKTGIDGFSPELLGLFIATNGVNSYTFTKSSLKKQPKKNTALETFNKSYEKMLGDDPMTSQMIKSFLPKTFEINVTLADKKINYVSDTEAYIKGDFMTVRRTYDFNELITGAKNTALELRFNE